MFLVNALVGSARGLLGHWLTCVILSRIGIMRIGGKLITEIICISYMVVPETGYRGQFNLLFYG